MKIQRQHIAVLAAALLAFLGMQLIGGDSLEDRVREQLAQLEDSGQIRKRLNPLEIAAKVSELSKFFSEQLQYEISAREVSRSEQLDERELKQRLAALLSQVIWVEGSLYDLTVLSKEPLAVRFTAEGEGRHASSSYDFQGQISVEATLDPESLVIRRFSAVQIDPESP